jgi:phage-related protein
MRTIKKEDFKAVEFMRKRCEELSNLYNSNREDFLKQLEQVRKKYKNKFRVTEKDNGPTGLNAPTDHLNHT